MGWEKIFANHISNEGLIFRIYEELLQLKITQSKNQQRTWIDIPPKTVCKRRRKWQPMPVFLAGKSHGQRSLEDYNPWGRRELDTTEQLNHHQVANKHVKRLSTSLIIREIQIETIRRYCFTPSWMAIFKNIYNIGSVGKNVENAVPLYIHCCWECKMAQPVWKRARRCLKKLKIELLKDSAIPLLLKRIENRDSYRYLYTHVHDSIFHNNQMVQIIKCLIIDEWI